jgi:ABC-2 type transport system permease protein
MLASIRRSLVLFGAVPTREVRSRMRHARAAVILTSYVLILAAFAVVYLLILQTQARATGGSSTSNPTAGLPMFGMLSGAQLVLVLLVVPGLTAGAIAGERERQTLELLLCTRLTAMAIVMGKLLASLSYVLFLLVAALPVLSLVFLLGGVSPRQVALAELIAIVTALMMGSLGVLFSTMLRRVQWATVLSYAVVFVLLLGTVLIAATMSSLSRTSEAIWPLYLNPVVALVATLTPAGDARSFLPGGMSASPGRDPASDLWQTYVMLSLAIMVIAVCLSSVLLRPRRRRR